LSKYEFPSENNALYVLSSHPTNLSVKLKFLGELFSLHIISDA